jgi:hypothetical protein
MMSKSKFTALVLGVALASAAAAADLPPTNATLKAIEGDGKVMVNTGEEFAPASEGMRLKPGDRVMIQDDSSADIQFDDACAYKIPENRIVTIPGQSPCAGGVPVVQQLKPASSGAVGSAAASDGRAGDILLAMAAETAAYFLITSHNDDNDDEDDDDTVSP